jgi:hypothetical protein
MRGRRDRATAGAAIGQVIVDTCAVIGSGTGAARRATGSHPVLCRWPVRRWPNCRRYRARRLDETVSLQGAKIWLRPRATPIARSPITQRRHRRRSSVAMASPRAVPPQAGQVDNRGAGAHSPASRTARRMPGASLISQPCSRPSSPGSRACSTRAAPQFSSRRTTERRDPHADGELLGVQEGRHLLVAGRMNVCAGSARLDRSEDGLLTCATG